METDPNYYFYNDFYSEPNSTSQFPFYIVPFVPSSDESQSQLVSSSLSSSSSSSTSLHLTSLQPLTNSSSSPPHGPTLLYSTGVTILLGSIAALLCIVTISGNAIVVLSFFLEQSIRQPTNYFIASLAVSDLFIGAVSMPLYTVYLLADQYWPLSEFLCNVWLTVDYTACLCSIYTVFCITVDRYCSVKIPAKYRVWRTKKKVLVAIACIWIISVALFFSSIFVWQMWISDYKPEPGKCYVFYLEDALFNCSLQIGYFWITLIATVALYIAIYRVALGLQKKTDAKNKRTEAVVSHFKTNKPTKTATPELTSETTLPAVTSSALSVSFQLSTSLPATTTLSTTSTFTTTTTTTKLPSTTSPMTAASNEKTISTASPTKLDREEFSIKSDQPSTPTTNHHHFLFHAPLSTPFLPNFIKAPIFDRQSSHGANNNGNKKFQSTQSSQSGMLAAQQKTKRANRARKALRTITIILGAFVVCWIPWHVLSMIMGFCPKNSVCVAPMLYDISYWLCYLNSPINPFCYALANEQFKRTFARILKFDWHRI
ncbi:hypothetical protein HELRODRAFT_110124 [Helobdella robusta]|uniref:G-protein coupled receptors family 1 profile domain-containing protein n=1 Tax=Helobdella robusta TaxID=6412 RepID=T1EEZ5_HELRO|nr:hypothetical protein HELRODRAFT_110124 [Helobdella robusta]ESO08560.1 hypothetical protein HELRODRAFT_110124 [Helobdella robusta]